MLVAGLVLSGVSAVTWTNAGQANARKDFHAQADDVTSTLGILLQRDANFVSTLRTVLTMNPSLTPTQFHEWYRRLQGDERQVGGIGSAVISVVPGNQLLRFQSRRDADPAFIRLLGASIEYLAPTGQPQYCLLGASGALQPLTPLAARLVQQDWCNPSTFVGSTEATALWAAGAANHVLVTPINVAWLRTTLFEAPFYRRGVALRSPAERTANTLGWVVSSFDVGALLQQGIGHNQGLNVRLQYSNPDGRQVQVASLGAAAGWLTQRTVMSFDGQWTITVTGAAAVVRCHPRGPGRADRGRRRDRDAAAHPPHPHPVAVP